MSVTAWSDLFHKNAQVSLLTEFSININLNKQASPHFKLDLEILTLDEPNSETWAPAFSVTACTTKGAFGLNNLAHSIILFKAHLLYLSGMKMQTLVLDLRMNFCTLLRGLLHKR